MFEELHKEVRTEGGKTYITRHYKNADGGRGCDCEIVPRTGSSEHTWVGPRPDDK